MEKYIYEDSHNKIVSPVLQDQSAMIELNEEEMELATGGWGGYYHHHHHHHCCECDYGYGYSYGYSYSYGYGYGGWD